MKNKKLFAILTLVCFMFTLMPVAAFAASPAVGAVAVNDEALDEFDQSITVTEDDEVTFDVEDEEASDYVYIIVADDEIEATTTTGAYIFDEIGTFEVYAVSYDEVDDFINSGDMKKADKWDLIQEKDSFVDDGLTVKVKEDRATDYAIVLGGDAAPVYVYENGEPTDEVVEDKYEIYIDANGGWNEEEVTATLTRGGDEVEDAELSFSTAGYVDLTFEDGKTTDRGGEVEFKVASERAGEYKVIVKYGTKAKVELLVHVTAEEVANVAVATAPNGAVDMEQEISKHEFGFKFTDANGRAYDVIDTTSDDPNVRLSLTDKPADSNMDKDDFKLVKGEDAGEWYVANNSVDGFDAEGDYTIKATLKNGRSASMTFTAAEFGEVVGIKYDVYNTPRTVAWGETTNVDKVLAYDAAGVTRSVSDDAVFSANGAAVKTLTAAGDKYALLTAETDDDYIGSTITVFAEYEDYVTSTTLTVVDKATGISFPAATAEVGVNTEIKGAVVDPEGNRSSITGYISGMSGDGLILDKPSENAVAAASWSVDGDGNIVLDFLASEAGEYEVQVAISYDSDRSDEGVAMRFVSGIATVTVGGVAGEFADVVVVSIGADKMIVNSEAVALDVAPFIENGRTMMQFNVLYAFGVDVEWVAETQSIVAEGEGLKVVMQLGSKVATVNGEEVALDVAPQIVNGRTVVPVGFITGLLDITPTFTYNADGTIADILFTK